MNSFETPENSSQQIHSLYSTNKILVRNKRQAQQQKLAIYNQKIQKLQRLLNKYEHPNTKTNSITSPFQDQDLLMALGIEDQSQQKNTIKEKLKLMIAKRQSTIQRLNAIKSIEDQIQAYGGFIGYVKFKSKILEEDAQQSILKCCQILQENINKKLSNSQFQIVKKIDQLFIMLYDFQKSNKNINPNEDYTNYTNQLFITTQRLYNLIGKNKQVSDITDSQISSKKMQQVIISRIRQKQLQSFHQTPIKFKQRSYSMNEQFANKSKINTQMFKFKEKQNQKINKLHTDTSHIERNIIEKEKQLSNLMNSIKNQQKQRKKVNEIMVNINQENIKIKKLNQSLIKNLAEIKQQILNKQGILIQKNQEINKIQKKKQLTIKKITDKTQILNNLKVNIKNNQQSLQNLLSQIKKRQQYLMDIQNQMKENLFKASNAKTQIEHYQTKIQVGKTTLKQQIIDIQKKKIQLSEMNYKIQSSNVAYKQINNLLQQTKTNKALCYQEFNVLKQKKQQLNKDIEIAKIEKDKIKVEKQNLQIEKQNILNEKQTLQSSLDEIQAHFQTLMADVRQLTKVKEEIDQKIMQSIANNDQISNQTEELSLQLQMINVQYETTQKDVQKMKLQLEESAFEKADLNNERKLIEAYLQQLSQLKRLKQIQFCQLEEQISLKIKEESNVIQRVQKLKQIQVIGNLKAFINSSDNSEQKKTLKSVISDFRDKGKEIIQKLNNFEELTMKNQQQKYQNKKLKAENESLRRQLNL